MLHAMHGLERGGYGGDVNSSSSSTKNALVWMPKKKTHECTNLC